MQVAAPPSTSGKKRNLNPVIYSHCRHRRQNDVAAVAGSTCKLKKQSAAAIPRAPLNPTFAGVGEGHTFLGKHSVTLNHCLSTN